MKLLNRFFLLAAGAAALTACSDDDRPEVPGPGTVYDIVSFETSEGIVDPEGGAVALGECVLEGAISGGTFQNLYWTNEVAEVLQFRDRTKPPQVSICDPQPVQSQ